MLAHGSLSVLPRVAREGVPGGAPRAAPAWAHMAHSALADLGLLSWVEMRCRDDGWIAVFSDAVA